MTLGQTYEHGAADVAKSYPTALKYYKMAAAQREPRALCKLAHFSELGKCSVAKNITMAIQLWEAAVAQDQVPEARMEAQFKLGECYMRGVGVKKDMPSAFNYFQHAATPTENSAENVSKLGYARAQCMLGTFYER